MEMELTNQISKSVKIAVGFALFLILAVLLIRYSLPLFLVVIAFLVLLISMGLSLYVLQARPDDVAGKKRTAVLANLHRILFVHFSEEELRTLCFELEINFDGLPGQGTGAKSRELIAYCDRRDLLNTLIDSCLELRPKADWWDEPDVIKLSLAKDSKQNSSPPPLKYPQFAKFAIVGLVLPPVLGLALLSLAPSRNYVASALLGTATPTSIALPTATLSPTSAPSVVPSATPTPPSTATPSPTPLAAATASPDEILVLITEFDGAADYDPVRRIYDQLRGDLQDNPVITGRVVRLPDIVSTQEEAQQLGQLYDATLVIWGSFDSLGISPHYEVIRGKHKLSAQVDLTETANLPTEPDRFVLYVTRDMGGQLSYLSFFTLGQMAIYDGEFEIAMTLFDNALNVRPEGLSHDLGEATLYFYRGYINQVVNEDPSASLPEYTLAIVFDDSNPLLFYNRGLAYHDLEQYAEALDDYNRAIALDSSFSAAYYNRGNIYRIQNEYEFALNDFNQMLARQPDDMQAMYSRGFVHYLRGDFSAALQDFDQVILQEVENVEARFGRGLVNMAMSMPEAAALDFSFVLEDTAPDDIEQHSRAYLLRASAYVQLERFKEAEADLRMILVIDPQNAMAINDLAWLFAEYLETNLDEAILLAEQAIALAKTQDADANAIASYIDTLGWAYYKQGANDLAIEALHQALEVCNQCSIETNLQEHLIIVEGSTP